MSEQDSEWEFVKLQSIASKEKNAIVGGPFGSNLVSKDYVFYGVPVIRGQNMGNRWVGGEFVYVSEMKANSLSTNLAKPYDVVFTQRGTLGQVSIVPKKPFSRYVISQSQMKISVDKNLSDPFFVYYLFKSQEMIDYITRNTIQTALPHINLGFLKEIQIPLPPLPTQKAIAHILGTLDDKIELNRRMNETLESIARAIFTSWFINFDPVRAKAENRQPEGMDAATAALFPSEFETVEGQEIPKGWEYNTIGKICSVQSGYAIKSSDFCETGHPVLKIKNITNDKRIDLSNCDFISKKLAKEHPEFLLNNGDLVMAMTGATVGKYGLVINMHHEKCFLNQRVCRFLPKGLNKEKNWFIYSALDLSQVIDHVISIADGSAQANISSNAISSAKITIPSERIIDQYNKRIEPIFLKIIHNLLEGIVLDRVRDTLLPKLLSGELPIDNPEKFIEATV